MAKAESTKAKDKEEESSSVSQAKNNTQTIVIAVLSTVIVCIIVVFAILTATGVIRFSGESELGRLGDETTSKRSGNDGRADKPASTDTGGAGTTRNSATCYDDTRVQVEELEFCLPDDFKQGGAEKGVFTYNLVDDDGWADVRVHAVKSNDTPTQYITNLSSNLKVTDQNYTVNGTTWVRAEASNNMLAFATKRNGYVYAVLLTIKLDSDDTDDAWKMIPRTLTFVEHK